MTTVERDDLLDALGTVREALKKARYLMQELVEGYFEKYDPDKDVWAIKYDFERRGVFANLLCDQLATITAELPDDEWIMSFECPEVA